MTQDALLRDANHSIIYIRLEDSQQAIHLIWATQQNAELDRSQATSGLLQPNFRVVGFARIPLNRGILA
ncbi:MAG: hypothetical protein KDB22_09450, partial [Planctomycetales bacterium]|nr:hypothetical protein [Planctomycetales bacterium]